MGWGIGSVMGSSASSAVAGIAPGERVAAITVAVIADTHQRVFRMIVPYCGCGWRQLLPVDCRQPSPVPACGDRRGIRGPRARSWRCLLCVPTALTCRVRPKLSNDPKPSRPPEKVVSVAVISGSARPVDVHRDLAGPGVVVDADVVPLRVGDRGRCADRAVPLVVDPEPVGVVDHEDPVVRVDRVVGRQVGVVEAGRRLVVPDQDHVAVGDLDRLVDPHVGLEPQRRQLRALRDDGVLERPTRTARVGAGLGEDDLAAFEGPLLVGERVPVARRGGGDHVHVLRAMAGGLPAYAGAREAAVARATAAAMSGFVGWGTVHVSFRVGCGRTGSYRCGSTSST